MAPTIWKPAQTANTSTDATQPQVLALENGNTVVLWIETSDEGVGSRPNANIIGQLYDPLGNKMGEEFFAAGNTVDVTEFDAAALPDGGFALAYSRGSQIRAAELRADGSFDADFGVEGNLYGVPGGPTIAVDGDGDYLISYQIQLEDGGTRTAGKKVDHNSNGDPLVGAHKAFINSSATVDFHGTDSALLSNGNVAVVARSDFGDGGFLFRIVDGAGNRVSPIVDIADSTANGDRDIEASVAALAGGGFVVAWSNTDSNDTDLVFQRYDNNGQPVGILTHVSSDGANDHARSASVIGLKDGGFLVTWVEGKSFDERSIRAQVYDENGARDGNEFTVQRIKDDVSLSQPNVTELADGRVSITWNERAHDPFVEGHRDNARVAVIDPRGPVIQGDPFVDDVIFAGQGATEVQGDGFLGDFSFPGANDTLYAVGIGDRLFGGQGDDTLFSGIGDDTMSGGGGNDTVDYAYATGTVFATLNGGTGTGHGEDSFQDIENLSGSQFDDTLTGDSGDNILKGRNGIDALGGNAGEDKLIGGAGADNLNGGGGNDILRGDRGADFLDGDLGIDWAYYHKSSAGVTIDLGAGTGAGGHAAGDTLVNIERVLGSRHDDTIIGDDAANLLRGNVGDDILNGRAGRDILRGDQGADALNGGGGVDWAHYQNSNAAVTIDLAAGTGAGGHAEGDTLASIERVFGSRHDDIITGNDAANLLRGNLGDDILEGAAGNDVLRGDLGADTFRFANNDGADRIVDFEVGTDLLHIIGSSFDALDVTNTAEGAQVDYGTGTIVLTGVDANSLTEADFIF